MDTTSLCQDCGKLFTEKWMLQEHKKEAHDERVLKCDHCSIELVGLLKMKAHKQKHKQKECKKCSLLVFINSWSSHQAKCSETKFKCEKCSFETSKKFNLQKRIKSIHESSRKEKVQKEHKCVHCNKTFNMKKHLDQHVRIHSSVKELACLLCDKKFATHPYLAQHMKNIHLDKTETINTSEGHEGVFEQKPKEKEMKSGPSNECEKCDYKTARLPHLTRHLTTHDKVKKPTQCDKCDFTSKYSTTLKRHIKSQHKGDSESNQYRKINKMNVPKAQSKEKKQDKADVVFGEE